ncbi:hypothetical protein B0H67DRAFT_348298 [Lasiosphaeris hirsuta]|uniref:GIT Spa2 homology (SHD) domain-containing protein n=1 Tax=Lasiosphaeris hirsuta TaxID=260670 RepID=A0AA40DI34_9PEZI|nr:hypothetical protein B0H67DRAFT_348298 [Lasiosphaeris hirsuta]
MRLVPLSIADAIRGLLRAGLLNIQLCTRAIEQPKNTSVRLLTRIHFECSTIQIALAQLGLLFVESEVDHHGPGTESRTKGRDKLNVHQFITVLGEGVMAFDQIMSLLSIASDQNTIDPALLNAIARLQDFKSCVHLILNVLQSTSPTAAITVLTTATTHLLNNPALTRRLPTPHPLTLDDLPPWAIPVPVYAKDIAASSHLYHFGLTTSPPPRPASDPLPGLPTESDLLALFNAAMRVHVPSPPLPTSEDAGGKERLRRLTTGQFRLLCRDVYDELVQRGAGGGGGGGPALPAPPVDGFHRGLERYLTKTKLAGVSGEGFAALVGDVWGELGRRVGGRGGEVEGEMPLGEEGWFKKRCTIEAENRLVRCYPED